MAHDSRCGHQLIRTHRTALQKLAYSDVFTCRDCGHELRRGRRMSPGLSFVLSWRASCTRCGTHEVHRLSERDRIDSMSHHIVSFLFRLTGAPLNKCNQCRLQFYDWRPIRQDG